MGSWGFYNSPTEPHTRTPQEEKEAEEGFSDLEDQESFDEHYADEIEKKGCSGYEGSKGSPLSN